MAFSRVKVSGWAFGEILTSSQMNTLDTDHANALDGANGGTYHLAAPLIINGDHVTIGEVLNVGQDTSTQHLTVIDDATVGGALAVTGDASCDDLTTVGDITLGGILSGGRILATAKVVATGSSTVDITQFRLLQITFGTTTNTTLSGSVQDGDFVAFQNASGVDQNIVGLFTANLIPTGTGRLVMRIAGVWTSLFGWTS